MNPPSRLAACLTVAGLFAALPFTSTFTAPLMAGPFFVGAKACQECHKSEYEVWEKTKHFLSFRDLHTKTKEKLPGLLAAVGSSKTDPRSEKTCIQCHYTMEQADESATPRLKAGVSCESCHGAGSGYLKVHNVYGGPGVTRESEPAEHKKQRIEESVKLGMLRPDSLYDLAANCLGCHSLARANLDGATISKMLEAGHPINGDYELVKYLQGTVRHRFFPPHTDVNAEMTGSELARLFITGRAAMLVTATAALKKSDNPAYREALQKQIKNSTTALNAIRSLPEAAALIADPKEENAKKLATAITKKDLSAEVGGLLPKPADYK